MNPPVASPSRAPFVIVGVGLLLGLLGGLVIFGGRPQSPPRAGQAAPAGTSAPAPVAGAPAPEFTLQRPSGEEITLSDLRGQVVLINFWATWCLPCQSEMPAIQRAYEARRAQGFTVLAVDVNEAAADVEDFGARFALTFPLLLDPDLVVNDLYRVRGYPTSFFVDRAGVIALQHVGEMSEARLAGYLAQMNLKD